MAKQKKTESSFLAIRVEGGILPPSFLDVIANLEAGQQAADSYGIPEGLRLRDEINRYWKIAQAAWSRFQAATPRRDQSPASLARERFLFPLFRDVLQLDVERTAIQRIGDREFPVTHMARSGTVPCLLLGPEQGLDVADRVFGAGERRRSPHALLQEFLNAEDACLWGVACNTSHLRILRDNPSLTRPAFIEVDLERIFEEELYGEFSLLWLLTHASRLEPGAEGVDDCVLEHWRNQAEETGERALGDLRDGVTEALRVLGNGFLRKPENTRLREACLEQRVTEDMLFQQLLRLVYRLLFMMTVEERETLFDPNSPEASRERYRIGYSLQRLRELAEQRRHYDQHADLWEGLKISFAALAGGEPALGLPPLGGLFEHGQCEQLDESKLANNTLLEAVRNLSLFRLGGRRIRINYRDMGTEELGSVYESLLELVPRIDHVEGHWRFSFLGDEASDGSAGGGSARKQTGSYYTPDPLVQELVDSALTPVMRQRVEAAEDSEAALLSLSVVDPAVGSGHFLLAAGRRIAAELAAVRVEPDQPTGDDFRHALRDVVSHCLYGVDMNPLAVELCRTALWLEAVEPGKPLGFLDAHIRCGNGVVGLWDDSSLEGGIPDDAYKPLSGDDKKTSAQLKKRNREERKGGVQDLFAHGADLGETAGQLDEILELPEDTPEQVKAKREAFERWQASRALQREKLRANAFTAAFFAAKRPDTIDVVPTTMTLQRLAQGEALPGRQVEEIQQLASAGRFFHWYLEFPDVVGSGGFDCVLGNPPWEKIKLQEKEYFATRAPSIAAASNAAARRKLIAALDSEDASRAERKLHKQFLEDRKVAESASAFVRLSGRFPLTGRGDVNLYPLFAEFARTGTNDGGRAGLVVPTGIATDDSTKLFFDAIASGRQLVSLLDFENREGIFPAVHRSYKFSLMTLGHDVEEPQFQFFSTRIGHLAEPERRFSLSAEDILLMNPNSGTCPVLRSRVDAELMRKIYRNSAILAAPTGDTESNSWNVYLRRMLDKSTDSGLMSNLSSSLENAENRLLPIFEGEYGHQFDHRFKTYEGGQLRELRDEEKLDVDLEIHTEFGTSKSVLADRVRRWEESGIYVESSAFLGFRRVARSTDIRTSIACIFPWGPSTYGWILSLNLSARRMLLLCCFYNSFVFDYVLRNKLSQPSIPQGVFEQTPVPSINSIPRPEQERLIELGIQLIYTSRSLTPFARELGFEGGPYQWNSDERMQVRAEMDARVAALYGLERDQFRFILDPREVFGEDFPSETFRTLRESEIKRFGDFRSANLALYYFDELFG